MKKIVLVVMLHFFVMGCKKESGLELEIMNKSISSLVPNNKSVYDNMTDSLVLDKSKTIIEYKLTNHDSKTYFFNLNYFGRVYSNLNGISINKATVYFYKNGENKKLNIQFGRPNFDFKSKCKISERNNQISKMLNYSIKGNEKVSPESSNFVIHPNETLYFEWFLNLPYGNTVQNAYLNFDKKNQYNVEIEMFSDSVSCKNTLPRPTLKAIEKNGYEIYHGIIKSKNRVPIKFIN